MSNNLTGPDGAAAPGHDAAGLQVPVGDHQPKRCSTTPLTVRCLAQTLDAIDHGMLVLTIEAQLLHINHGRKASSTRTARCR